MIRGQKLRLRHFLLLSFFLHGLWVSLVAITLFLKTDPPRVETVQLEILEPTTAAAPEITKTARTKAIEKMKNQVVDQSDKALNDEKPDDARFLSKHNQVVQKQTVAQNHGEFQNKASKETKKGTEKGTAKPPTLVDLKPKFDIAKAMQDRAEREQAFVDAKDGDLAVKQKQEATAEKAQPKGGEAQAKGADVSQTVDYIKDLDAGLETLLSTKEFVYYSYFNRIRSQLNQYWTDKVRQKLSEMYKKGRMIASSEDKVTKCLITLDTSGKLMRVQIIGDSGVHELDQAAIEAFKAAAPFPNPPKGMIDPDGTIKIRWDFILEA